jgi:hypothetical protein
MNSDDYEELVASIARSIAEGAQGVLSEDAVQYVGRTNLWPGVSGYEHRIDVSIKDQERVTLIECKYWSKPVTPEAVLTLQGRLDDIRPTLDLEVEGMMVTNRFVGPGAKQLAQHFGIRCSVVKSPDEAWLFWYAGNATIQPNPVPLIIGINPPTIITSDPSEDENI